MLKEQNEENKSINHDYFHHIRVYTKGCALVIAKVYIKTNFGLLDVKIRSKYGNRIELRFVEKYIFLHCV